MQKKIFCFVLLAFTMFGFNIAGAQVFTPRYLDVTSSSVQSAFKAGDAVDLKITFEKGTLPEGKTSIEYGVVRRVVSGNITQYEPISIFLTEDAKPSQSSLIKNIKAIIPNVVDLSGTSTYVFYAKTSVINDSDKESFVVSKQSFQIKGDSSKPITKIKYINLLQSNGKRFGLSQGPSIYDLSATSYKGVASSTSLEITFESNVETTLHPGIKFKKLRSDIDIQDLKTNSISINKGLNRVVVPLPTFNYEAGVYQGVMTLDGANIPVIDFQYIVSGDMVTFTQPEYFKENSSQVLKFDIYGTPFDFDLDPVLNNFSSSTMEKISLGSGKTYKTEFVFKDKKDKEVYRVTDSVDFSTSSYSLFFPLKIKNVSKVSIESINDDGKIVYKGTKDLNLPKDGFSNLLLILMIIVFVVLLVLVFVLKNRNLKTVMLVIAIIILALGVKTVLADAWNVPDGFIYSQSTAGDALDYKNLTIWHAGFLIRFNVDIQKEAYDVNENLEFMYSSAFEACNNNPTYLRTAIFLSDESKTLESSYESGINSATGDYSGDGFFSATSYQKHNTTYLSPWYSVNLGKAPAGKKISVKAGHVVTGYWSGSKNASIFYSIPLLNITDRTTTRKCVDGKIQNIVTVGQAPYYIRTISETPTTEVCTSIPRVAANVESVSSTDVKIVWTYEDVKPQADYQIELSGDPQFNNIIKSKGGANESVSFLNNILASIKSVFAGESDVANIRSASFDGLTPDTLYYVRMRASNGSTWSDWFNLSFSTNSLTDENCPNGNCQVNSVSYAGCGISVVQKDQGLGATSPNLCINGFVSKYFILNSNITPIYSNVWNWKCEKGTEVGSCSAKCGDGLMYCSLTQTCSASGCGGDMCQYIGGVQTTEDPIFKIAQCVKPELSLIVKFNKPYADESTSKCSVNWSTVSSVDPKYTKCTLDGEDVVNPASNKDVIIGRHTLACVTEISGADDKNPSVLKSDVKTSNFRCSKTASTIEK